jgi:tRNA dimethylallyltransferase
MKINKKYLIVLVGPTASSKTKLSLDIANFYNSEIISADSRQFYKELEIGTAKPSNIELTTVKHHFINNLSIHDDYSVGRYNVEVNSILNNYYKKNNIALLVGGSGLFIDVICNGIDEIPKVSVKCRNEIIQYYKSNGIVSLRKLLKKYDIKHYQTIDLNNPQRLMRALEVCIYTKKPFSSFLKKNKKINIFNIIKIGLSPSKDLLYNNINLRVDKMIEDGLIEEALKLYSFRDLNSLQTVGYKELFEFFDSKISKEEAIELIKRNTRRYAKRQMTWFKRDSEIKWFDKIDDSIFQFLKNINV